MKLNYHKEMMKEIEINTGQQGKRKLLLHSCCAPCSAYVLELMAQYFEVTVFFFNPNIYPPEEYDKRLEEQIRLVNDMALNYEVVGREHESQLFYHAVKGYEKLGEGSERCSKCFELRLAEAADYGVANDFDYFTTTLTISPLKNAAVLNEIGNRIGESKGIKFLPSDFKKNNGYKRSTELSREHDLYRQNYCGCVYSYNEMKERENPRAK